MGCVVHFSPNLHVMELSLAFAIGVASLSNSLPSVSQPAFPLELER